MNVATGRQAVQDRQSGCPAWPRRSS